MIGVQLFVESLLDRHRVPRDSSFQLRIKVEVTSSFNTKVSDIFVRKRVVLDLVAGEALLVYEQEPLIREDEQIPDKVICLLDLFVRRQDLPKVTLKLVHVDFLCITEQPV